MLPFYPRQRGVSMGTVQLSYAFRPAFFRKPGRPRQISPIAGKGDRPIAIGSQRTRPTPSLHCGAVRVSKSVLGAGLCHCVNGVGDRDKARGGRTVGTVVGNLYHCHGFEMRDHSLFDPTRYVAGQQELVLAMRDPKHQTLVIVILGCVVRPKNRRAGSALAGISPQSMKRAFPFLWPPWSPQGRDGNGF